MEPVFDRDGVQLYLGDAREVLRELPDESVHCCITSPPYWGLRDYGTGTWIGGSQECDHVSGTIRTRVSLAQWAAEFASGGGHAVPDTLQYRGICGKCGATRSDQQLGLEDLHDCLGWATGETCGECYVCHVVGVFHAVRRILRDDGTLWLNLGDSYASQGGDAGGKSRELDHLDGVQTRMRVVPKGSGLKPKDLCGIPWRVALALQADGWYLRQDIIWHKPNPMPESVGDRCTKSHEYLFLLAKSERYYWDAEAMLDPASSNPVSAARRTRADYCTVGTGALKGTAFGQSGKGENAKYKSGTRNRRSVWTVATKPYKGAHFATFPLALIEPCILAGCPAGGVVLDPFMGSGTTAIVAQRNGRRSIGCELSGEYLNLAVKRFSQRMLIQPEDLMERDCDDAGV